LLAGLAWMARWNPRVAWPGLWFLLILAPTSSFLPRPDPAFEHRVYLPMVGIVAGLVLGGLAQAERAIRREPVLDRALRMGLHAALAGMLFALGALTYARNQVFASETRVWEDVLTKRATNLRAYVNLANALYAEGRFEEMGKVADQGLALVPEWRNVPAEDLPRLLEEDKTGQVARQVYAYAQLQNAAGMSWFARGNREEAEQRFIESIRLAAGNRRARANLAVAWTAAGRHADARALWADLLATDPGDASAHFGMAETCAAAQDFERAREHYRQCLAILPDHVAARERLARLPNPAE
jgi:tetratricopeptide (TPR) repeat protein